MTVTEYRDRFLQLARYAPADVADDRKKQEHFMEGLEDYLQYALLILRFDDFNHLVDSCKDRWTKRGGELGLFQFLKQSIATLTYAMLVGHQFTNRITKLLTQAKRAKTK